MPSRSGEMVDAPHDWSVVRCGRQGLCGGDDRDQAKARADGVSNDGAMDVSWDRSVDAAYISLIPPDERIHGVAAESVTLEQTAEDTGIEALHSLVLDFDRDGS